MTTPTFQTTAPTVGPATVGPATAHALTVNADALTRVLKVTAHGLLKGVTALCAALPRQLGPGALPDPATGNVTRQLSSV